SEGTNHVRIYHWVMPWNQIRQTGSGPYFSGHMWVPVDDHETMVYNWDYLPEWREDARGDRPPRSDARWFRDSRPEMSAGNAFGKEVDPESFQSFANRSNF